MLWFKNVIIYRLNRDIGLSTNSLEKRLMKFSLRPCTSQDLSRTGWVSPLGSHSDTLTYRVNGQLLLCARKEVKMLSSLIIKQNFQEKIDKLEAKQHRKLKKIEKDILKDEVLRTLLPRAFSRFSQVWLWIDTVNQLIMVDAGSAKKAEETLALLRKTLGLLPVVPLSLENQINLTLTEWVRSGDIPSGFTLQDEAELKSILKDGGVIRCKKQALVSDEVTVHIKKGKVITKLALDWQERIQFVLAEDGTLKRLKFAEMLRKQNDNIERREDVTQSFDADFILMTNELSALTTHLVEALGGEAKR
ncbi:MAG: recombination-associated protein RdgC [Candidatus Malihini olakiniferum]